MVGFFIFFKNERSVLIKMKKFTSWGSYVDVLTKNGLYRNILICPTENDEYHLFEHFDGKKELINTTDIIEVRFKGLNKTDFVCSFPSDVQKSILSELQDLPLTKREIEDIMDSRLCDLEDTIDINEFIK